jgi:hypothetical protein
MRRVPKDGIDYSPWVDERPSDPIILASPDDSEHRAARAHLPAAACRVQGHPAYPGSTDTFPVVRS